MKKAHKHKNVRLRVLKYFKVEGDGEGEDYKVTRTKQECPHPDCGAGVFMAQHENRSTCGKCSLTYVKDQAAAGKKK
jgi:small subunit ribosomal protein S27Ae